MVTQFCLLFHIWHAVKFKFNNQMADSYHNGNHYLPLMPVVHSHRVCSGNSRARVTQVEAVRVWLCTLLLWALNPPGNADWKKKTYHKSEATARWDPRSFDSDVRRPLKKWVLTMQDTSTRGYMRASEARQVFPSTFSLSPCLGFSWWECTASIMIDSKCNNSGYHSDATAV